MSEKLFPISEKIVNDFIEVNTPFWSDKTIGTKADKEQDNTKYIYINLSMVRMQVAWIIPKLLFAKGIEKKTGCKILVLVWKCDDKLRKFIESFDVKVVELNIITYRDKVSFLKTMLSTLKLYITGGRGNALRNQTYKKYPIGLYLYEDIIRTSSLSTIHNCWNKIVLKKYSHIMWTYNALDKYIKKNPAYVGIFDDLAYHEAMFIQLFDMNGAKTFLCSNWGYGDIYFNENKSLKRRMPVFNERLHLQYEETSNSVVEEVDDYLEERFKGNNGREIDRVAFANKEVLSRAELIKRLDLDSTKKTVVIMAHTFTDAVFNYGNYYFRDYYDWLDKTLKIAENIKNVNWLLKPHPTREAYNESEDSIEDMFSRHINNIKKSKDSSINIYYIPDEVSGESIKNIADTIITIGGNAGGEYACFGIPAVIIGKTWYAGFGYTIEPKTYEEYEDILINISEIKPLSEEQQLIAKKVFYLKNIDKTPDKYAFNDEFAYILNGNYRKMVNKIANSYFKNDAKTEEYNEKTLFDFIEYIKNNDMKKSISYLKGYNLL